MSTYLTKKLQKGQLLDLFIADLADFKHSITSGGDYYGYGNVYLSNKIRFFSGELKECGGLGEKHSYLTLYYKPDQGLRGLEFMSKNEAGVYASVLRVRPDYSYFSGHIKTNHDGSDLLDGFTHKRIKNNKTWYINVSTGWTGSEANFTPTAQLRLEGDSHSDLAKLDLFTTEINKNVLLNLTSGSTKIGILKAIPSSLYYNDKELLTQNYAGTINSDNFKGTTGNFTNISGNKLTVTDSITYKGKVVNAFIVEEGKKSSWYYRKWNNGIVEAWISIHQPSKTFKEDFGVLYSSANGMDPVSYPFTFTSIPKEFCTVTATKNGDAAVAVFAYSFGRNSTTKTGRWYACRGGPISGATTASIKFDLYVIGSVGPVTFGNEDEQPTINNDDVEQK